MSLTHRWMADWIDEAPALLAGDVALTYGALRSRVRRAATWLSEHGVGEGRVVALQLPKEPAFLELCLAAWALGAAVLPLNDRYTPAEVVYACDDAGVALAVLTSDARVAAPVVRAGAVATGACAEHPLERVPSLDRLGALLYTSGTTGRPKGARLSQRNLGAMVDALHGAWRWSRDDVLVHALPVYHVHGLFVAACGALRAGATQVWLARFDADEVVRALNAHRGTVFMGVPTFYTRLLACPGAPDLSGVRLFTSGSAPLPARVHRAFAARFGHAILERYGTTETGIVVSNPYDGERRPGAVGFPLAGTDLRVVGPDGADVPHGHIGEVWIRGPSVFQGYHGRPEATRAALVDGWMRTGDEGHVDDDGYLVLAGRRADLVLCGGLNVYPGEVEAVLAEVPGVREVAVVGVPDPDLGEVPVAFVAGDVERRALVAAAREKLAPYKVPRAVHRLDALPRNAMGKIQRNLLRGAATEEP